MPIVKGPNLFLLDENDDIVLSNGTRVGCRCARCNAIRDRDRRTRNQKRKVLVVDDDFDLLITCSAILEDEGYDVEVAMNGRQAIDKISEGKADVVLLDIMMPILDGFAVCETVKSDSSLKNVPIVIMSASDTLRKRGERCADAVLSKPFDIDNLVNVVGNMIASRPH